MAVHTVRDMTVGATGSYANLAAVASFITGVLGFVMTGSAGLTSMLPVVVASGTMADFPHQRLYMSGGLAYVDIPLGDMPRLPANNVGTVHCIPSLAQVPTPQYLNVLSASTYMANSPTTTQGQFTSYTAGAIQIGDPTGFGNKAATFGRYDVYPFAYTGSAVPSIPGTSNVILSGGAYYVSGAVDVLYWGWFPNISDGPIHNGPPFYNSLFPTFSLGDIDTNGHLGYLAWPSQWYVTNNTVLSYSSGPGYGAEPGYRVVPYGYFLNTPSGTAGPQVRLNQPLEKIATLVTFTSQSAVTPGTTPQTAQFVPQIVQTAAVVPVWTITGSNFMPDTASGVTMPAGFSYTLGVKSAANSLANSGLFPIVSMDYSPGYTAATGSVSGTYRITFDPRISTGSKLPLDTNFQWTIIAKSTNVGVWDQFGPAGFSDNSGIDGSQVDDGRYHTSGSSHMLRAIYQSPHSTRWQVRLCMENKFDRDHATNGMCFTVAPGFSGSSTGDFAVGGPHLHGPMWFNTSSASYKGTVVGLDPRLASGDQVVSNTLANFKWRFYAWGDDTTGTVLVLNRNSVNAADGMVMFGIPEDETVPLPPRPIQRLFAIGANNSSGNDVDWANGPIGLNGTSGVAYSLSPYAGIISCVMSCYSYLADDKGDNIHSIRYDANAADTPFLSGSELIPADIVAGTWDNNVNSTATPVFNIEPRRMGRVPFMRFGRSTGQPQWSTVDSGSNNWFHAKNGVYLPWGGVDPL